MASGNHYSADEVRRKSTTYWALEESLGYLARQIYHYFSFLRENRTRGRGVSAGQWSYLRELWREDGITQRALSQRLAMRDPTTAVTLRGLERKGFIYRKSNPSDRREMLVFLTCAGRSLEPILLPLTAEIHSVAIRGLSENEVATLRNCLNRIIENLRLEEDARRDLYQLSGEDRLASRTRRAGGCLYKFLRSAGA